MSLGARLVGVPVAVALAVVVPLVIVNTSQQQTTPQQRQTKPEPKTASVKWRISGQTGGAHAAFLALLAAGPPPEKSAVLVDETGTHSATLTKAKNSKNCPKPRRSGVGNNLWCLVTSHVDAGHELTATVDGAGTKFTVTLDRKNAFFEWHDGPGKPFWCLVLGLAAAFVVAIWPARLTSLVENVQLKKLLRDNEDNTDKTKKIASLSDWVAGQVGNNADLPTVWAAAARVIKHGPEKARASRESLKEELDEEGVDSTLPYIHAARDEARRQDHRADDFLKADGKEREAHPAAEYEAGVKRITAYTRHLYVLEQKVKRNLRNACQTACLDRIIQATTMLQFVESTDQLTKLDDELWDSEAAYAAAYSRDECREGAEFAEEELAFERVLIRANQLALMGESVGGIVWAWSLTIASILIALGFAGLTVYEAAYAPNNTFATKEDYFKLFSAALASGVAATVVAFIGNWRPPKSGAAASST